MRSIPLCLACILTLVFAYTARTQERVAAVSGTVIDEFVAKYPTVVYIEEMSGQTFPPPAEKPIIKLEKKTFSPRVLPVLVGTTVEFSVSDRNNHKISSPDGEKYDLGQIKPGQTVTHTFDSPGVYLQACAEHPDAIGYILVLTTPFFTVADEKGSFRIPNVPVGKWKLKVWNEGLGSGQVARTYDIEVDPARPIPVEIVPASVRFVGQFWTEPEPPPKASNVERGAWLFRQKGCFLCHGEAGIGGVRNRNDINGTVPKLDDLAERLGLEDPEDVAAILEQLEVRRDLDRFVGEPLLPRHYEVFLSKYNDTRNKLLNGNLPGKYNPNGVDPPLVMASWKKKLSIADIDALMAYLLSLGSSQQKENNR